MHEFPRIACQPSRQICLAPLTRCLPDRSSSLSPLSCLSTHPKTRYVVANLDGMPGWVLLNLAWALPDRMRDLLF